MSNSVVNLPVAKVSFSRKGSCDISFENIADPVVKLPKRILFSFIPPIVSDQRNLYSDFLGPVLATLILISVLSYGSHCKKIPQYDSSSLNVVFLIFVYYVATSFFIVTTSSIVNVRLNFFNVFTLIGYSFYGYILTLLIPFTFDTSRECVFYTCLILFGGSSCFRVLVVILLSVSVPVARFLICIFIGNSYVMFVIYLHYYYMHPTYNFERNINQ